MRVQRFSALMLVSALMVDGDGCDCTPAPPAPPPAPPAVTASSALYDVSDTAFVHPLATSQDDTFVCVPGVGTLDMVETKTDDHTTEYRLLCSARLRDRKSLVRRVTTVRVDSNVPAGAATRDALACRDAFLTSRDSRAQTIEVRLQPSSAKCSVFVSGEAFVGSELLDATKMQPPQNINFTTAPHMALSVRSTDGVQKVQLDAGFPQKIDVATFHDPQSPLHMTLQANFNPQTADGLPIEYTYEVFENKPPEETCHGSPGSSSGQTNKFAAPFTFNTSGPLLWKSTESLFNHLLQPHFDGTIADLYSTMYVRVVANKMVPDTWGIPVPQCFAVSNALTVQVIDQWSIDDFKRKLELAALVQDLEAKGFYEVRVVGYTPPKIIDDEYYGYQPEYLSAVNVNVGGIHYSPGCTFNMVSAQNLLADHYNTFWKELGGLLQAVIDGVGKSYEQAKWYVANQAAYAVCAGNASCQSSAAPFIMVGMNAGLAALGIPPSIPNTKALMKHGAGYVAAEVAGQVADPSGGAVSYAVYQATFTGTKAGLEAGIDAYAGCVVSDPNGCKFDTKNPYTFGRPDPYTHKRPAVLYVQVKPAIGDYAQIAEGYPEAIPALGTLRIVDANRIFFPVAIPLPRFIPEAGLILPVTLQPAIRSGPCIVGGPNDPVCAANPASCCFSAAQDEGDWIANKFGSAQPFAAEDPNQGWCEFCSPQSYRGSNPVAFAMQTTGTYQHTPNTIVWGDPFQVPAGEFSYPVAEFNNIGRVPQPVMCP